LACVLATGAPACSAFEDDSPLDCIDLTCLEDGRPYAYRPTREATQPVPSIAPGAVALPESAYAPIDSDATHTLTFAADLERVEVESLQGTDRLTGTLLRVRASRFVYGLDAFAGGELSVWFDAGEVEAEITLFGSGVPVASSTRGVLVLPRSSDGD
jgi:hypothetical protein